MTPKDESMREAIDICCQTGGHSGVDCPACDVIHEALRRKNQRIQELEQEIERLRCVK
jgi:hypothetical protein